MANRAMTAKVERARRQAGALAQAEYSKPFYAGHLTISEANATRAALAVAVAAYQGKITVCRPGHHHTEGKRSQVSLGTTTPGRAALNYGRAWNQ